MSRDFSNKFKGGKKSSGESTIDWEAYNTALVAACGTQAKAKSVAGVISGVVYLGEQELEDAKMPFAGDKDAQAKYLEEYPENYFEEDADGNVFNCFKQRPARCYAITVDFPKFPMDYDKFFGDGSKGPVPVRTLLNGEFTPKGKKPSDSIVGRKYEVKWEKVNGEWTLKQKSFLYKLAVATEVVQQGEALVEEDLGRLIGRFAQFELRIFKNDKGYVQEKVSFKGAIPEEVKDMWAENGEPSYPEDILYAVSIDDEDNLEHDIKMLRRCVVNTMKQSPDFEGSPFEAQLNKLYGGSRASSQGDKSEEVVGQGDSTEGSEPPVFEAGDAPDVVAPEGEEDTIDDEIPF